jgi:hypothetical protein
MVLDSGSNVVGRKNALGCCFSLGLAMIFWFSRM